MNDPLPNGRLPHGRHRIPPEVVADHQRRRLLDGVASALAEHGYAGMTVGHIIAAAGVSRTTFYEIFANKRDCVLAAHHVAFGRLMAEFARACATEYEWPHKLRAAIAALFAFALVEPTRARLLTVQALATDPATVTQLSDCNTHLAALLREGRRHTPYGPGLPDLTEEALVGAVSAVIGERLGRTSANGLDKLEREVVQLLLTPYVGAAEAVRVASASG